MKDAGKRQPTARLRRFKPYPKYKDSGVEWFGEIPAQWRATALKRIGNLQAGAGFPDDEQGMLDEEVPFFKVGDMGMPGNEREMLVHQHSVSRATARRLGAFVFPPGAIVFAKVGAALLLNRRRLLMRPSCIDNNMMGFMPDECDSTWAMYWLSGLDMAELANPGAVPSVNEGQMRDTPAAVPPVDEQRAIATFLNRETARIDALVAKKERVIELLKEKRTALITRAVTKGLDPNVPMKDSGVEWLGGMPAHWEVKKATWLFSIGSGTTPRSGDLAYYGGDTPWITTSELRESVILATEKNVTEDALTDHPSLKVHAKGSVAVAMYGATIGRLGILGVPAAVNQACCVFSTPNGIEPQFWFYWLQMRRPYLISLGYGGGQPNLSQELLRSVRVPTPPVPEQRAIVDFLDYRTAEIDALVTKVRSAIDRLKELRTALISAAVTGKIDVREEVA